MRSNAQPRMRKTVRAVLATLGFCCVPVIAGADQTTVGITINGTTGAHIESQQTDAIPFLPLPTFEIDYIHKWLRAHVEILPPIGPVPLAQGGSFMHLETQNPRVSYLIGDVRYEAPGDRFSVGIGETIINQQTEYPPTPFLDASRVVGFRIVADGVLFESGQGQLRASFAASPSLHGLQDGSFAENGSLIDTSLRWNHDAGPWIFGYGVRYVNYTAAYADGTLADRNHLFMPFVAMDWKFGNHTPRRVAYHGAPALGRPMPVTPWHFGFTVLGTNGARSVYASTTVAPMPFVLLPLFSVQRIDEHSIVAFEAIPPNQSTNLFGSLGQEWSYVNADVMARFGRSRYALGIGDSIVNLADATPPRYADAFSRSEGLHGVGTMVIARTARMQTLLRASVSPYLHLRSITQTDFPPPSQPASYVSYQHGARVDMSLQQTLTLHSVSIVYGLRYINQTTNYGSGNLTRTYSLDPFLGISVPR